MFLIPTHLTFYVSYQNILLHYVMSSMISMHTCCCTCIIGVLSFVPNVKTSALYTLSRNLFCYVIRMSTLIFFYIIIKIFMRMDTMAQFTLSHMILIIVPCRDNGVNTTRNVAPRRIFCIFVSTFGQYVKRPGSGSRRTQNSAAPDPAHDPILLIFSNLLVDVFI